MHLEVLDETKAGSFVQRHRTAVLTPHNDLCHRCTTPAGHAQERPDQQVSDSLAAEVRVDCDR